MPPSGGGHGASSATYSFSSQPKPVTANRKKYRDPSEADITIYRDLKETCITWDKRVHRGNTYSMYTQNAIKEALQDAARDSSPRPRAKRKKPKEPALFDMPLPERERIPVDLTAHLVAKEVVVEVGTVEAQTDEFLPEPPAEQYQPQKTGVDACTQVEDGELFNFDYEVEPILDVLVNKTLEQSIMEVEEEHEMASMRDFKDKWHQRQEAMMKDWEAQVQEERRRWEQKEQVVKQKRKEKVREAQVLLKIQAVSTAKQHLSRLVPNAVSDIKEIAFPDEKGLAINRIFLPQLLGQVQQEVQTIIRSQQQLDEVVAGCMHTRLSAQSSAYQAQRERHDARERKRYEEMQIRRGKIRILVDDRNSGGKVSVGPIQISSEDSIDEVQDRVFRWLQENEPSLASAWPCGVTLLLDGAPVESTVSIFEAKAGQISMVPKPEPPAPEEQEGDDDAEDGSGAGDGTQDDNEG
mmetsp:Transcript_84565/g.213262  ORF Transcript_84565/g.213262 Transcript_84565/m.213262 type:complete len:466 (-) Transcript_84565:218-1615(-)